MKGDICLERDTHNDAHIALWNRTGVIKMSVEMRTDIGWLGFMDVPNGTSFDTRLMEAANSKGRTNGLVPGAWLYMPYVVSIPRRLLSGDRTLTD